jgi:hypothetical protein
MLDLHDRVLLLTCVDKYQPLLSLYPEKCEQGDKKIGQRQYDRQRLADLKSGAMTVGYKV